MTSYRAKKLGDGQTEGRTHTQTDADKDNTWRPKLAWHKNLSQILPPCILPGVLGTTGVAEGCIRLSRADDRALCWIGWVAGTGVAPPNTGSEGADCGTAEVTVNAPGMLAEVVEGSDVVTSEEVVDSVVEGVVREPSTWR